MTTLLIATRNDHKVGEIRAILGERFIYRSLRDYPDPPGVVEDADTFAGNASKKAIELASWLAATDSGLKTQDSRLLILADDSGLEVDALGGKPGVHSARFAALDRAGIGNSTDAENNVKLLRQLQDVSLERRTARFRCVIALVWLSPRGIQKPELFDGSCEGRIGLALRGEGGFGYDPLFVPTGYEASFAELGEDIKNKFSHRACALQKVKTRFAASA